MGTIIRFAAATTVLLGVLVSIGVVGTVAGEVVPDTWVADGLLEARDDGLIDERDRTTSRMGNIRDQHTECVALSVGLGEAADAGFVETLAESPHLGPCSRLVPALDAYAASGALPEGSSYLRYWHGTSGPFRWLVAAVGVGGLRILSFVLLLTMAVLLARRVTLLVGWTAALGLVLPLVVTSDFTELLGVAHHSTAMTAALFGAYITLTSLERRVTRARAWFAPLVAGAIFVYVDLFTHVPGAWILSVAMALLAGRIAGHRPWSLIKLGLLSSTGWLAGYAGMWAGKWILAAMVLGRQRVVDDVRDAIDVRLDGESPFSEQGFGHGIDANLDHWLGRPLTGLVLAVAVLAMVPRLWAVGRRRYPALVNLLLAAVPAVVPLVWFEVLSNHSQIHFWYTYRSLPIALGVLLLAVLAEPDLQKRGTGVPPELEPRRV